MVLVPSGLLIMLAYHLFLLHRCLNRPHTTVIGFENNDKKAWVDRIMQMDKKDVGIAQTVINANTSAAISFCSVSLSLSSLIGAWLGSSSTSVFQSKLIYGDTRPLTISIKYVCLLSCFLLSFFFFVQSTRHFVHANYLISTPLSDIPVENVETAVIRGSNFWSVGLRALYFALNLLLWFFGPIPMFVSSLIMVAVLHYLDSNSKPLHKHQYPSANNNNNNISNSNYNQGLKRVGERRSEVALTAHIHGRKLSQVGE
ncbi:hypothetical protein L484_015045 [Morus notabilis]|uniref:DUF599 domain-containing protein n=2 Tax=Morus notabilis TaxID=981085 RepID=W9S794_9ROSA|nr:hypothetical protein L484_015045 [Morus notabilis]